MTVTVTDAGLTNPLRSIELEVQDRAERLRLDPAHPDDAARVRELIADVVDAWNAEHQRGRRPFPLLDPAGVTDRAGRNLLGHGPLQPLLDDPDVWEIMVNAPHAIFVRRHAGESGYHDEVFHDDDHVERTLTKLLDDNAVSHRKLDPAEGLQDAQLRDGSRLHIVHGDLTRGGHLVFNIRRHTGIAYGRLDELVGLGTLSPDAAHFLRLCVTGRASMVFAGAPGTGKTTLLSCCCAELDPGLRVVVAEEVFETSVGVPNVASLQTRPARGERPAVDLRRLVAGFLRMAPDVAIVGEVRDKEALPLLLTLSSGVTGYTTIHAASASRALSRLRFVCQLAEAATDLPANAITSLVSDAVDVVVHLDRRADGVHLSGILAVEDHLGGEGAPFTVTEVFAPAVAGGPALPTGQVPVRLAERLAVAGIDLRSELRGTRP